MAFYRIRRGSERTEELAEGRPQGAGSQRHAAGSLHPEDVFSPSTYTRCQHKNIIDYKIIMVTKAQSSYLETLMTQIQSLFTKRNV